MDGSITDDDDDDDDDVLLWLRDCRGVELALRLAPPMFNDATAAAWE